MKLTKEQQEFIDAFSATALDAGVPPSIGKVISYLILCQPAEQSAEEIQSALHLSVGSVSMALKVLGHSGAIDRRAVPGTRRYSYRLKHEAFEIMVQRKLETIARARKIVEDGMSLPGADDRMRVVHKVYEAFEKHTGNVMKEISGQL